MCYEFYVSSQSCQLIQYVCYAHHSGRLSKKMQCRIGFGSCVVHALCVGPRSNVVCVHAYYTLFTHALGWPCFLCCLNHRLAHINYMMFGPQVCPSLYVVYATY